MNKNPDSTAQDHADNQYTDLALQTIRRYTQLCLRRDGWRNIFYLLSKYLLMRPVWFGDIGVPWRTPLLSVVNVSDDACVTAAYLSAMALSGALWPNADESFEVVLYAPANSPIDAYDAFQSDEIRDYEREVTHRARRPYNTPECGFLTSWNEHILEQVIYGTSGLYINEDDDTEKMLSFQTVSIETSVMDEGKDKFVNTVILEFSYTAREVVDKYGIENVSDRVKSLYDNQNYEDYIKVLQMIEPRQKGKVGGPVTEKPFSSIHIEYDSKNILLESGFDQMPVFMTRFTKRPTELYGRSLGMAALPSVKELNVLRKAFNVAQLKQLDPPLGIYHDQVGGGGQVNISAGARVPLYATGRLTQTTPPIIELIKVPDPKTGKERIAELTMLIAGKFLLDQLLDFNNKTRMTKGEADLRNDFRNQSLSAIFSRQIIECLNPCVMYTLRVQFKKGIFGLHPIKDAEKIAGMKLLGIKPFVMPKLVADMIDAGHFPFRPKFISPAARAMQADSLAGLEKWTNYTLAWLNGGVSSALDNVIVDKAMRHANRLYGAPADCVRGDDSLKKLRTMNAQQKQAQQDLQQGEMKANIGAKVAKAAKDYAQAGEPGGPAQQEPPPQIQGGQLIRG